MSITIYDQDCDCDYKILYLPQVQKHLMVYTYTLINTLYTSAICATKLLVIEKIAIQYVKYS